VDGATDYLFKIKTASVTAFTADLASQLSALPAGSCGGSGHSGWAWPVGVAQDVTGTRGCAALGLHLPLLERELMRMEPSRRGGGLLLYLGQTDTEPALPGAPHRPTAFQRPLVQCGAEDRGFRIETNELFAVEAAMLRSIAATQSLAVSVLLYAFLAHRIFA
jgi:hypothetical protein